MFTLKRVIPLTITKNIINHNNNLPEDFKEKSLSGHDNKKSLVIIANRKRRSRFSFVKFF